MREGAGAVQKGGIQGRSYNPDRGRCTVLVASIFYRRLHGRVEEQRGAGRFLQSRGLCGASQGAPALACLRLRE
jgi:hypothetical protein